LQFEISFEIVERDTSEKKEKKKNNICPEMGKMIPRIRRCSRNYPNLSCALDVNSFGTVIR